MCKLKAYDGLLKIRLFSYIFADKSMWFKRNSGLIWKSIYLFCQTYKIFFNLYVFIRKNTYFYAFKLDVQGFSIYKQFQ